LVRLINFGSFGLTAEPLAGCTNLPAFDQISLFNDFSLCKLGRSTEETTVARARVLLVGLDPDIVDYTKSPVPGLTAAKVRAAVETDSANLETLGYSVRSLYVDDGKTAEAVLTDALTTGTYDCIMIGAGLRIVPPYFLLFEKLINIVHRHAPASTKLCFNSNPADTAEAVKRWV
jgi:hypothetical protein